MLDAPFASPNFTLRIPNPSKKPVTISHQNKLISIERCGSKKQLQNGTFYQQEDDLYICFELPKGKTEIQLT
jgi:hypothetical protein